MKLNFLLLLLLSACTISAQLNITPGAQFSLSGNVQLTLQNIEFRNNGNFMAGNSLVTFSGDISTAILGIQPIQFFEMEIKKTNNSSVDLLKGISVSQRIVFTSGFLNLNSFNTDLGTTGSLDGEKETSRVTGIDGGEVIFNTVLNAPVNANPANLGAIITSAQNLGNVTVKRGHKPVSNAAGSGSSVLRTYNITPSNNTGLNATLRFNYFDGELNGLDENSLVFFKSDDGVSWSTIGFAAKNAAVNFVEKNNFNSFSRLTLSSIDNPLPVQFVLFNARCEGNNVILTWKTAHELNSSRFDIERSIDGTHWTVIGSVPAAGNSGSERSYSFMDNNHVQSSYYRIAEHDVNGRIIYTGVLQSSCDVQELFTVSPNPFHDAVFVNIVTDHESAVSIHVFDSKGALVKIQKANVLQGSNRLRIDLGQLASGVYSLSAEWGTTKKTVQILKH